LINKEPVLNGISALKKYFRKALENKVYCGNKNCKQKVCYQCNYFVYSVNFKFTHSLLLAEEKSNSERKTVW